jgi:hypothetical protein
MFTYLVYNSRTNPHKDPDKYLAAYNDSLDQSWGPGSAIKWAKHTAKNYHGVVYRKAPGSEKLIKQHEPRR